MSRKNSKKAIDICFISVCVLTAALLGIGIFLFPHENFSENENRSLAARPILSSDTVASGRFFSALSSFYSDHIPFREQMIRAKAICELSLGKRQNNDVLFSADGTQTDRCEYDSTALLEKNLLAIKEFSVRADAICTFIPRSIDVRGDYAFSSIITDKAYSLGICDRSFLERLRELKNKGYDPYYKTDHHLNSDGIFALYEQLSDDLGYTPHRKSDFGKICVSSSFLGSIYSRSGLLRTASDDICLYRYSGDEGYDVVCFDKGCELGSLYDTQKLSEKDKYSVYLSGNHGLLSVSNPTEKRPHLLIIKDSFANALIPLLARHFDITAVDPRYYEGSVEKLFNSGDYDKVLVLFGIDTLATTRITDAFLHE
jgi:hypothetical protein